MDGKRWEHLFLGFGERERAKQAQAASEQELVVWYDEHTQLVMRLLREVVSERVDTLGGRAGLAFEVEWPSHPAINIGPDGPFMSFMCLRMPGREVHLYSHRVGFAAPMLHFVVTGPDLQRRLVGRSGYRIEQREGGGFLLRSVADPERPTTVSVDDVAYRAFELLLGEG